MGRPSGWFGVELRHLQALEAVASEASFHRAAAKLGYTQSAVSQQIAALERVVGQRLVDRPGGAQPVRLTRAGEIVLAHARAIRARVSTAQAELQTLAAGDLDPLRLGFFGRGLGALMPGTCSRLQAGRGDVQIRISEARTDDELLERLLRGEIDLSFVHLPVDEEQFGSMMVIEDGYVLVVEARSTSPASATLDELAALPLIGFKPGKTCQLTDYFRSYNLEPSWLIGSDDVESIYAFVAAGCGAALLPRLATLSLGPAVRLVDLDCGLPPRRIGLAWSASRGQSGSARAFVDAAVAEAARFEQAVPLAG